MHKINLIDLQEEEYKSPTGKFHAYFKGVSIGLGREEKSMDLNKRHPFDLEWVRLPPGAIMCPYHSHSSQWELYMVISGCGVIRDETGKTSVKTGDAFIFPPGCAHQLLNESDEDFVYYVIANNPISEWCYYPDSQKWLVTSETGRTILKGHPTHYFDGEE